MTNTFLGGFHAAASRAYSPPVDADFDGLGQVCTATRTMKFDEENALDCLRSFAFDVPAADEIESVFGAPYSKKNPTLKEDAQYAFARLVELAREFFSRSPDGHLLKASATEVDFKRFFCRFDELFFWQLPDRTVFVAVDFGEHSCGGVAGANREVLS